MKRLIIRVQGSNPKPYKIQIPPGTRTGDILAHLKLHEDAVLALASDPTAPFPHEADVHSRVTDGEHLIARSSSATVEDVDAYIRNSFK